MLPWMMKSKELRNMNRIRNERRRIHENKLPRITPATNDGTKDLVCDDDFLLEGWNNLFVEKVKKKPRFVRKYLQHQPKKIRKRKCKETQLKFHQKAGLAY